MLGQVIEMMEKVPRSKRLRLLAEEEPVPEAPTGPSRRRQAEEPISFYKDRGVYVVKSEQLGTAERPCRHPRLPGVAAAVAGNDPFRHCPQAGGCRYRTRGHHPHRPGGNGMVSDGDFQRNHSSSKYWRRRVRGNRSYGGHRLRLHHCAQGNAAEAGRSGQRRGHIGNGRWPPGAFGYRLGSGQAGGTRGVHAGDFSQKRAKPACWV